MTTSLLPTPHDPLHLEARQHTGPSPWEVPREHFTERMRQRFAGKDTREGRKERGVVIDAVPVNGRYR